MKHILPLCLLVLMVACVPCPLEISGDEEIDYVTAVDLAWGEYNYACDKVHNTEFADREHDDRWFSDLKRAIDSAKSWSGAIQHTRPPARYVRLHSIYESALKHYDLALDYTYRGYKEGNEDLLWKSVEELRIGNEIMDETDAEWDRLQGE